MRRLRRRPRPLVPVAGASARPPRVLAFGNYGCRNLGDEATLAALHESLRRRRPDVELVALSYDRDDTERRHGLPTRSIRPGPVEDAEPAGPLAPGAGASFTTVRALLAPIPGAERAAARLRRALRTAWTVAREPSHVIRCLRAMDDVNLLMFSGGGPLCDDFGGPWSHPYLLAKLSLAARLRGARVAFVSVGAGPLDHSLSRFFVRFALRLAAYRSFRDEASLRLARSLGVRGMMHLVPDLAFGLRWETLDGSRNGEGHDKAEMARIGVNPYPFQDRRYIFAGSNAAYAAYLDSTADFVAALLEAGHEVTLVPSQLRIDPLVGDELARAVEQRTGASALSRLRRPPIAGTDDLRATLSSVNAMLVTRFHGILLSFVVGTPVVGLCCHPKMDSLMLEAGQWRHRVPLHEADTQALADALARLREDSPRVRAELAERVAASRAALEDQLDRLLGPAQPGLSPS